MGPSPARARLFQERPEPEVQSPARPERTKPRPDTSLIQSSLPINIQLIFFSFFLLFLNFFVLL